VSTLIGKKIAKIASLSGTTDRISNRSICNDFTSGIRGNAHKKFNSFTKAYNFAFGSKPPHQATIEVLQWELYLLTVDADDAVSLDSNPPVNTISLVNAASTTMEAPPSPKQGGFNTQTPGSSRTHLKTQSSASSTAESTVFSRASTPSKKVRRLNPGKLACRYLELEGKNKDAIDDILTSFAAYGRKGEALLGLEGLGLEEERAEFLYDIVLLESDPA
jgi:hypothetical protein